MSNSYTRHTGLPHANVASGTTIRGTHSTTSAASAYSNHLYAHLDPEQFQMSRQESRYSVRAELDAGEPVAGGGSWQRQSNGSSHDETPTLSYHAERSPFFTPTYLARSRHVQRLKHEWEERNKAQQLADNASSTNSSTTNLPRIRSASPIPSVHRGVSQRVIERPSAHFTQSNRRLRSLPTRWYEGDRAAGVEVLGDGTEVRLSGVQPKTQDEAASIRADAPVPKEVGLYYYEATILSRSKDTVVGIGFATDKVTLSRLPGWESESFAYHGDDGDIYSGQTNGRSYGPHLVIHDVIGCGINFRTNTIFFTRNGVSLGIAFTDVKPGDYYPTVGFKKLNEHVRANFGRHPFVFDIDGMMDQERKIVAGLVHRQHVNNLHPPDDESTLIQNLISQYLAHEGYVETSRAFQQDLNDRKRLAPSTSNHNITQDAADDIHAINRQRIRRAMLDGDIDSALKYTKKHYPQVLQKNKGIYFRLRCRRFIEMMRRWSEMTTASELAEHSNGHTADYDDDDKQADTQMELDDQLQREAAKDVEQEDIDMDSSFDQRNPSALKQNELIEAAVRYGQELRKDFEANHKQELDKVFSLWAYNDVRTSDEVRHLVDKSGRSTLAEELNGAILVSLGKPSSAALEKLCLQTESLLDEAAKKYGGPAAFVNVRQDFLHL